VSPGIRWLSCPGRSGGGAAHGALACLSCRLSALHISRMPKTPSGIPLIEVIAPDGSKSLWAAAVGRKIAVKIVQSDHIAKFSGHRLPVDPALAGIRRGDVRKVEPCPPNALGART
jgi:hypothetical protein